MHEDSGSVQYVEVIHDQSNTTRGRNNTYNSNSMIPREAGDNETDSPTPQKVPQARYSSIGNSSGKFELNSKL